MTVWVVHSCDHADLDDVVAVFSTQEAAEACVRDILGPGETWRHYKATALPVDELDEQATRFIARKKEGHDES